MIHPRSRVVEGMSRYTMDTMNLKDYLEEYLKTGYTIVKGIISEEKLEKLNVEIERLMNGEVQGADYYKESGKDIIRRIEKVSKVSETLNEVFHNDKLMHFLTLIFEEAAVLFKDKVNLKLPSGAGFKPHLDGHFYWIDKDGNQRRGWQEYSDTFVNCVIAIDDTTIENGCLQVADKQQTEQLGKSFDEIVTKFEFGKPDVPNTIMKNIKMVPLETQKGDVIFFDWKCIHGSDRNNSDKPRRILYATYNPKSRGDNYEKYFEDKNSSKQSLKNKALA